LVLGNLKLAAASLKIPYQTAKQWKGSEWWKDVERDLTVQEDLQLSARLQRIVNKSYDVVEDRMANGDFVYDQKSGEMRRKPVAMRDAHRVGLDLQERRDELLKRHVAGESITTDKIEQTLKDLADQFARIANTVKEKPSVEVTDVIFADKGVPDASEEPGRES
jgi:predicted RNA-binding Zn ribbon-like protein